MLEKSGQITSTSPKSVVNGQSLPRESLQEFARPTAIFDLKQKSPISKQL